MSTQAKLQAMHDMSECGIIAAYITHEKVILELTRTDESEVINVDFRKLKTNNYPKNENTTRIKSSIV